MNAPPPPAVNDTCPFDFCATYPILCDLADDNAWGSQKRNIEDGVAQLDYALDEADFYNTLEERSGRLRQFEIFFAGMVEPIILEAWKYPPLGKLPAALKRAGLAMLWYNLSDSCTDISLEHVRPRTWIQYRLLRILRSNIRWT